MTQQTLKKKTIDLWFFIYNFLNEFSKKCWEEMVETKNN